MKNAPFEELASVLSGDQPPRVWSLLVTIFGELAQEPDARISGALIRHLSALIGIKPEAVRVALHRLRKDGWIDSQRKGRNSHYGLTDWGRAQSVAASPLIYGTHPPVERAWLVVFEPGHEVAATGTAALWLTANLLITTKPPEGTAPFATPLSKTTPLPDWMTKRFCDENTQALAQHLVAALGEIGAKGKQKGRLTALSPSERAALRVLVVHDWRRIVLKLPTLPDFLFPAALPMAHCREAATSFLHHLPKEDLAALERSISA